MVDTHAHLGLCEPDAAALVAAARDAGVRRILTVGLDETSNAEALTHAREHAEVRACVGRHPNSASGFDDAAAAAIEEFAADPEVVAIGETGLDFYREHAAREDQRRAFLAQIEIARRVSKPLVIHVRNGSGAEDDAVAEVFETLAERAVGTPVVLHCFSAPERVEEAIARGWHCSFAGNVTYRSAQPLRAAAQRIPDELILVETDAPFLTPQAQRGRPNEPANVVATAEVLARLRDVAGQELEAVVEGNAARLFAW